MYFLDSPIERRFGWYRCLGGAVYFVSICQILEAEKSIRLRALLKFSNFSLEEAREKFVEVEKVKETVLQQEIQALSVFLVGEEWTWDLDKKIEDCSIIFYVAGSLAHSLPNRLKCEDCVALLSNSKVLPCLSFVGKEGKEEKKVKEAFVAQVNRGGLLYPRDLLFVSCVHIWKVFSSIKEKEQARKHLLSFLEPRKLFVQVVLSLMQDHEEMEAILLAECSSGHCFNHLFKQLCGKMFNCFMKNLCTERNSTFHSCKKTCSNQQCRRRKENKKIAVSLKC